MTDGSFLLTCIVVARKGTEWSETIKERTVRDRLLGLHTIKNTKECAVREITFIKRSTEKVSAACL